MHFYFGVRGVRHQVEKFEMFMQSQMFVWKRRNLKTNKIEYCNVQGALRHCFGICYEYIFPEESLREVLTMLHIRERHKLSKTQTWLMRKVLGPSIKKVPKYEDIPNIIYPVDKDGIVLLSSKRYIEMNGVAVYPIGIKKDNRNVWEEQGYEQEML